MKNESDNAVDFLRKNYPCHPGFGPVEFAGCYEKTLPGKDAAGQRMKDPSRGQAKFVFMGGEFYLECQPGLALDREGMYVIEFTMKTKPRKFKNGNFTSYAFEPEILVSVRNWTPADKKTAIIEAD